MKDYEATFKKFWEEVVTFPAGVVARIAGEIPSTVGVGE